MVRWGLFLGGLLLALAFINDWQNAALAPRWIVTFTGAPLAVCLIGRRPQLGAMHAIGLAFWALSLWLASSAPSMPEAYYNLALLACLTACFALGSRLDASEMDSLWLGLALGIAVQSVLVLGQQFASWQFVRQAAAPAGLFVNKNVLAESALLALIFAAYSRRWWLALLLLPSFIIPFSRATILAAGLCFMCYLWTRARVATLALALAAVILITPILLSRQSSNDERLGFWQDTAAELTIEGHGLGSFYIDWPKLARHSDPTYVRAEYAHNEWLQLAYELGPLGLLLALGLFTLGVAKSDPFGRAVLIALGCVACFSFPFHLPFTACCGAVLLGSASQRRLALRPALGWRPATNHHHLEA